MEVPGFRVLSLIALSLLVSGCASLGRGGEARQPAPMDPQTSLDQPVIEPQVSRREIRRPAIDARDLEVGLHLGVLSIEDFESNAVYGLRLAYHLTEDLFLEASLGRSEAGRSSYERLSGAVQLLQGNERDYSYYSLAAAWTVLPGETFVGRGRAYNSGLYVLGGLGSTRFAGDDRLTVDVGFGYRVLPTHRTVMSLDVRDHIFDIDLLGEKKVVHNLAARLGLSFFF